MTTTPPTTPPLDAAAFASGLHAEVARLRAAALCQRSLLEAVTAQLDALQVPQTERPAHHLGAILKTAIETIPTLDDAAARLLAVLQDVDAMRGAVALGHPCSGIPIHAHGVHFVEIGQSAKFIGEIANRVNWREIAIH